MHSNARWFQLEGEQQANELYAYVCGLMQSQSSSHYHLLLRHVKLYTQRLIQQQFNGVFRTKMEHTYVQSAHLLRENIVRSAIDAVHAKVTSQKVLPKCLTDGGDFKAQQSARAMNRYMHGLFYQAKVQTHIAPLVFRDSCITGTGIAKVFVEESEGNKKRVAVERVSIDEIVVDMEDAYYGTPSMMFQIRWVNRDILKEMYPEHAQAIQTAQASMSYQGYSGSVDTVMVIEGWKLATPQQLGKHVTVVNGATLFEEEYKKYYFPFAIMRYSLPVFGFYGSGIAEELTGLQIEINQQLSAVQESMRLLSKPKIFMRKGASGEPRHFNNQIGTIIEHEGEPPLIYAPSAVPVGALQQIAQYKQDAYRLVGISELSAASQKPAGLDSGVALREFRDSETERFAVTVKGYEQFHIDLCELMLDAVREIGDDYQVSSFDRQWGMENLSWKDINLDKNQYVLNVYASSALPKEPSARLQQVTELVAAGMLPADEALELMDMPDIDTSMKLQLASTQNIMKQLYNITVGKPYRDPEPDVDDLNFAIRKASQLYSYARLKNASEEVQLGLRSYIDTVASMVQSITQPAVNVQPAPAAQIQNAQLQAVASGEVNPQAQSQLAAPNI
jgi:hypothetical protein